MSSKQNYQSLTHQVKKLSDNFQLGKNPAIVQKIFSTTRYVCFSIRVPGKTHYLYLGRGKGFEGIWSGEIKPPSNLRCIDKFLEYLRRYVTSLNLQRIELDTNDRIISFLFMKNGKEAKLCIFYKGPNLYFVFAEYDTEKNSYKLFKSWENKKFFVESLKNIANEFNEVGRFIEKKKNFAQKDVNESDIVKLLEVEKNELVSEKENKKKKQFFERKKKKILKDIEKTNMWKELQDYANDSSDDLSKKDKVQIKGITVKLSRNNNHYQNRNIIFNKAKGFKKGLSIQEKRLEKVLNDEKKALLEVPSLSKKIISPVWKSKKEKDENHELKDEIGKHYKNQKYHFVIGTDARENDKIRTLWAKKTDWWFHVDNQRSSHGVLRNSSDERPPIEIIQIIASAIKEMSRLESRQLEIVYTQVKNLKGVKGSTGKVIFKKEKRIMIDYLSSWKSDFFQLDENPF